MAHYNQKLGIKLWAEDDRPREKLSKHGRRHLTDAELIAILIGSGNKLESAVDLSKRILAHYENSLYKLGQASIQELSQFNGIGEAKAISIIAGLELGLRRKEASVEKITQINSSTDVFNYMHQDFAHLHHEEFWILLLNRANQILGKSLISKGGQAGTVADPKIIFKIALQHNAASIILMHNHPSGNLKPSNSDLKITQDMVASGQLLSLQVIDHLIFSNNAYFSFKDEGII